MKAERMYWLAKKFFLGLVAVTILVSLDSCVRRVSFLTSSVVPAARGYVKVKKDNNQNYVIQMDLFNLAEVKRLQPPKNTYVVWMVTDKEVTNNLGQIESSSSIFSRKLKASFQTVSTLKPSKIFITAEDDASASTPGATVVLTTDKF